MTTSKDVSTTKNTPIKSPEALGESAVGETSIPSYEKVHASGLSNKYDPTDPNSPFYERPDHSTVWDNGQPKPPATYQDKWEEEEELEKRLYADVDKDDVWDEDDEYDSESEWQDDDIWDDTDTDEDDEWDDEDDEWDYDDDEWDDEDDDEDDDELDIEDVQRESYTEEV